MGFAPPPAFIDERESAELLEKARSYIKYNAIKEARHALAQWLCYRRSVITDSNTEKIHVYDQETGYYHKAGELMLKADLAFSLDQDSNNHTVNEVIAKVRALSYRDTTFLNELTPLHLIPFQNGVYNTETMELVAHSPKWFFTYKHPVVFDPKATCPQIDKFLNEVVATQRDREILLDILALCLHRDRVTRKFFILTGSGHNGKSKYIDIARAIVGPDRCVSVTPQHLAENDFAPSLLFDKHANLGADIPGGKIYDASVIKGVTGGDSITVQKKGKDHFDIRPYCEFVYSSNNPPRFSENTYALWDRLVVVNFPYTFTEDPITETEKLADKKIEKKILEPKELSGLLNKILARLPTLLERRDLSVDIDPIEVEREYNVITNGPEAFLNECCEAVAYEPRTTFKPAQGWENKTVLYNAYTSWARDKKLKIVSQSKFARWVLEAPGWPIEESKESVDDGERVNSYRGVVLKNELSRVSGKSPILSSTFESKVKNRELLGHPGQWISWIDNQPGGTVPVELFLAYLVTNHPGVDYEQLKINGEVYEPRDGYVRRVL